MKKTSMINEATVSKKVVSDLNYYFGDLKPGSPTHKFAVKEILKSALIDANFSDLANKLDTLISGAKWDEKEQGIPATSAIRLIKRKGEDIAKDSKWDAETIINSVSAYLIKTDTATAKKIQSLKNSINEGIGNWVSNYISELSEDNDPCWDNYEMVGMKTKDGEEVPNCVPKNEAKNIIKKKSNTDLYPNDVVNKRGSIMTTATGKKFKVLTTKPKPGTSDFYYDTIMNRIEQLDSEDWDVDVSTYKKAKELYNKMKPMVDTYLKTENLNENQYIGLWDRTFAHLDKVIPNYNSNPIKNFNNVKHAIRVELFKGKITDRMAGNIAMEYELYRNGEKTRKGATNAVVNYLAKFMKKNESIKEGNAFTGALYNARKEGLQEFEFNGKKYPVYEEAKEEETITEGVWSNIMKGVKKGDGGPWSIVAIQNNKVVAQKIDIKTPQIIPAHYEGIKKEYPNALIRIEDGGGVIVWSGK